LSKLQSYQEDFSELTSAALARQRDGATRIETTRHGAAGLERGATDRADAALRELAHRLVDVPPPLSRQIGWSQLR
jgi:hypothetical protein